MVFCNLDSVEQQQLRMAAYGKVISQADSRIREHIDETTESERVILKKLTNERENMMNDIKVERQALNEMIADAVKQIKQSMQIQKEVEERQCEKCLMHLNEIAQVRREMLSLTENLTGLSRQLGAESETNASLSKFLQEVQTLTTYQSDTIQTLSRTSSELDKQLKHTVALLDIATKEKNSFHQLAQELENKVIFLNNMLRDKVLWIDNHLSMVQDYKVAINSCHLTNNKQSLADYILQCCQERKDLRNQIIHDDITAKKQMSLIEHYKSEIVKKDKLIAITRSHLEGSIETADALQIERDYAITKIKETVYECKHREACFQKELEAQEKKVLEVLER
ncbi:hypothetical protein BC830DRAFT_1076748 [Chytriomyces sp. MP71]|nr:hypothetical protein BC830DRAFT_1076748 [Chytriomyces sp. MP71]